MGFQVSVSGECIFSFKGMGSQFQGNGFLTVFKLDVGEEHEDEDDMSCWGRT